jgi:flavin-dependent dehydrogenase
VISGTDVLIIGGGPAGLAAAIAARIQGFRVTVADGARPPIEKACGEGLLPDALTALRELDVVIKDSDGFPFRGVRLISAGATTEANFPEGYGIGVRRITLHQKMVERAQDAGIELRWGKPVGLCSQGAVVDGKIVSSRWIIGADGIASRVRKWSGLQAHTRSEYRFAFRRHYSVAPWSDCAEVHWSRHVQAYVTPVARQQVCVVLISRRPGIRFAELAAEFPELAKHLKVSDHAGSVERGAITGMHRLERVCRGNVALIGDASGSVDAITGQGLCLSFHQARVLASALQANDLSRYQAAHRQMARRPALMGRLMLLLDRHARLRERAVHVLAAGPDLFARLLAIHVGAASPAQFFKTGMSFGWRFLAL